MNWYCELFLVTCHKVISSWAPQVPSTVPSIMMVLKLQAKPGDQPESSNSEYHACALAHSVDSPIIPKSAKDLATCSNIRHMWLNILSKTPIVDKEMSLKGRVNSKFPTVDRNDRSSPWCRVVFQKLRNKLLVLINKWEMAGEI
jgi:hypothetical protein